MRLPLSSAQSIFHPFGEVWIRQTPRNPNPQPLTLLSLTSTKKETMEPESISSPPKLPSQTTNITSSRPNSNDKKRNKKQLPSPEEILTHYESQGLDTRAASLEAISHLQTLLFKTVSSNSAASVRKVDTINTRLAIIEAKLDSKPGFVQSFAIGVFSGAVLNGFGSVFPHVLHGLSSAWNSVRVAMANSNSNASS